MSKKDEKGNMQKDSIILWFRQDVGAFICRVLIGGNKRVKEREG